MGLQWGEILRAWGLTPAEWGALGEAEQRFTAAWYHARRAKLVAAASGEGGASGATSTSAGTGLTPTQARAELRRLLSGGLGGFGGLGGI